MSVVSLAIPFQPFCTIQNPNNRSDWDSLCPKPAHNLKSGPGNVRIQIVIGSFSGEALFLVHAILSLHQAKYPLCHFDSSFVLKGRLHSAVTSFLNRSHLRCRSRIVDCRNMLKYFEDENFSLAQRLGKRPFSDRPLVLKCPLTGKYHADLGFCLIAGLNDLIIPH